MSRRHQSTGEKICQGNTIFRICVWKLKNHLISGHRGRKTILRLHISVQLGTFPPRLTIETPLNGPKEGRRESGGETLMILHCRLQPISTMYGQGTGTELEPLQLLTKVLVAYIYICVKQCLTLHEFLAFRREQHLGK